MIGKLSIWGALSRDTDTKRSQIGRVGDSKLELMCKQISSQMQGRIFNSNHT